MVARHSLCKLPTASVLTAIGVSRTRWATASWKRDRVSAFDDVPALIRQKLRKFREAPLQGDDEASRRDGCEAQGYRGDLALYKR